MRRLGDVHDGHSGALWLLSSILFALPHPVVLEHASRGRRVARESTV